MNTTDEEIHEIITKAVDEAWSTIQPEDDPIELAAKNIAKYINKYYESHPDER
jgi:hypothetical protein